MKATGIVRRVDDLGRIVIPKEIRRTARIKEGDPMEIFIEDGAVVFKKYEPDDSDLDTTNIENFLDDEGYHLPDSDRERLVLIIKDLHSIRENFEKGD